MGTSKRNKNSRFGNVVWPGDVIESPAQESKKKVSSNGLKNGITEPSQSKSPSPLPSVEGGSGNSETKLQSPFSFYDKETPQKKVDGEPFGVFKEQKEVTEVDAEIPKKSTKQDPRFKFGLPKQPSIIVNGEEKPITIPAPYDVDGAIKQYQSEIDNKTPSQELIDGYSSANKVSKGVSTLLLNGKVKRAKALDILEKEQQQSQVINNLADNISKETGVDIDVNSLTDMDYSIQKLDSIKAFYESKMQEEMDKANTDIAKKMEGYNAPGGLVTYKSLLDRATGEISNRYNTKIQQAKNIFASKVVNSINNDKNLLSKLDKINALIKIKYKEQQEQIDNSGGMSWSYNIFKPLSTPKPKIDDELLVYKGRAEVDLNNDAKYEMYKLNAEYEALNEEIIERTNNGKVSLPKEEYDLIRSKVSSLKNKAEQLNASIVDDAELESKYPILKKEKIVGVLNDYYALTSGNVHTEDGEKVPKFNISKESYLIQNGINPTDPMVDDAEDYVKDYSTLGLGKLVKGFTGVFKSSGKSLLDLTPLRTTADMVSEKISDELMPSEEQESDVYKLNTFPKIMHNINSTTGQVVGQAVLQRATMGLGKAAGMSTKVAETVAFGLGGALPSFDDAYKESLDFIPNNVAGRFAYSTIVAGLNAITEKIFPDAKVLDKIPGIKNSIVDIAQNISKNGAMSSVDKSAFKDIVKKIAVFSKEYGKETAQEVAEEGITSAGTDLLKYISGDKTIDLQQALKNLKETTIQTATGMPLVAGFGAYKSIKKDKVLSNQQRLYNAALYIDESTDAINKGFKEGKYDEKERNEKMQILNTAVDALNNLKTAEKATNTTLSPGKRAVYVSNLTAEAIAKKELKELEASDTKDDVVINKLKSKIENLQNQRNELFDNKLSINKDGSVTDNRPYYIINGYHFDSKEEFLINLNLPSDKPKNIEVGNDPEIQSMIEKEYGGKTEDIKGEAVTKTIPNNEQQLQKGSTSETTQAEKAESGEAATAKTENDKAQVKN